MDKGMKRLKLEEKMLFRACAGYNLPLVRELLSSKKLSPNITDEERTSLLHVVLEFVLE